MTLQEAVDLSNVLTDLIVKCDAIYKKCESRLVEEIRDDAVKQLKEIKHIIRQHRQLDKALKEGRELWKQAIKDH